MPLDLNARKLALRRIPYGLYVVTTTHEGEWNGFTGSWLTQASFEPPLLALAIRRDSTSFDWISKSGVLVVNWIRKSDRELAERFFRPVRRVGDKFGDLECRVGITGAPILERALAFAECRVAHVWEGGDHALVAAEILDVASDAGEALTVQDTPWHYGG